MSESDSLASVAEPEPAAVPERRWVWPVRLRPFRPIVWPGLGPRLDPARAWPESAIIVLAVLLFWRGAALTDTPNGMAAAGRALLNPIFGLPAALLGVTDGVRLALLLGLLAAAGGMWWLAVVLGLGRAARVWTSLAYAFAVEVGAGWSAGRFGLDLGYPWLPWALACALLAVRWRRSIYAAGAAAALALILLGGDFGLTCATAAVLALFLLVASVSLRRARPYGAFRRNEALIAALIGLLGFGLAAIQLLPQLAAAIAGTSASNGAVAGAGLGQFLGALIVRPADGPPSGGLYAYLGIVPFLFLAGLPKAVRRENRRLVLGLGVLAVLALLWAAGGWLGSTGAPAAILAWGALALLALAGLGFDALWRWAAANLRLRRVSVPAAVAWAAAWLGIAALAAIAALSVIDLYRKSRPATGGGVAPLNVAPLAAGLGAGDLWRGWVAQYPALFWVGAVMSILSLIGFLALIVGDVRGRRSRIETDAVYEGGVLRPAEPLALPDGTPVHVTVAPHGSVLSPGETVPVAAAATIVGVGEPPAAETAGPNDAPLTGAVAAAPVAGAVIATVPAQSTEARRAALTVSRLGWILFALGMFIYAYTRLSAIDKFPIYFFADEATHAVYAQDLLDRGFKAATGHFLPIYFEAAGNRWTPLLSVYVHAVSVAMFGKSILVTRATSALVSLLAAVAVALMLKYVFKSRYWWVGALLMAVAPAWFLHSRTGFETVMMSSFYACFLLFYMLYRTRSPRFLFAAILFGAATFYTYSNGQMIMAAAAVMLALSDLRYHLKQWRTLLLGLLLIAVLAIPVLAFRASQPESMGTHLRAIDSYLFHTMPVSAKVAQFAKTFAYGLSPAYWFIPNTHDLVRHLMKGYGHLNIWLLPFMLVGVGLCLWRVKSSPHRALLLGALATPVGAALVDVSITRVLAFIPPACVLIGLGLDAALDLLNKRARVPYWVTAGVLFLALSASSLWMLRDALTRGPLWYGDYGLYGMQYGARQIFEEALPELLAADPNTRISMTSTWANGADTFIRFFMPKDQAARVQMLNVDYYLGGRRDLDPNTIVVMTPNEYERAVASGKFQSVDVERMLPYPDGAPGFYFVRLAYADNLEAIVAQERAERSKPVQAQVTLDGQTVQVVHSQLDMGTPVNLFDGDTFTLVRGLEANPLMFEFTFPEPRPITGLGADFASMDFNLTAKLYADAASEPLIYTETYRGLPPDPHVDMAFAGAPPLVQKIRLEIEQLNPGNEVHIHVRELDFK
jgi:4-amino-4-deoxy-L-arabinose transferase-like glycosyltransferase